MPDYRVFTLLKTGRINGPSTVVTCEDDKEVIEKGRRMLDDSDVEIWDGPRRVVHLKLLDTP